MCRAERLDGRRGLAKTRISNCCSGGRAAAERAPVVGEREEWAAAVVTEKAPVVAFSLRVTLHRSLAADKLVLS